MSQESTPGTGTGEIAMQIRGVYSWTPPETEPGEGITIRTNRGDIPGILHQAQNSRLAVIWVYGARGGYGGPGSGTYTRLAEQFVTQGITSLRLDYRKPNHLPECVLDLLAGVAFFKGLEYQPVVVVGHSFGGAVVICAGAGSTHVKGVVCLSSQTYGADQARLVSPRPLLLVHGKADTRLPFYCSQQIYDHSREPKQLVLYEGAEHRLDECKDELEQLLSDWIPATLAAPLAEDAGA